MDNQKFEDLCKQKVADFANKNYGSDFLYDNCKGAVVPADVYIVWITKVLQNNKALAALPVGDGMYYELTYNGDKDELYLDAYKKQENILYGGDKGQLSLG